MSRRRYFEEQRSGNEAIYHCVEIDTDHDTYFEVLDLMSKDESDTVSPDKVNNILNQLRQGSCFNIHTQSIVSFEVIKRRSNAILIQNADEDVDCMTYARDTSLYSNNSFFVFV